MKIKTCHIPLTSVDRGRRFFCSSVSQRVTFGKCFFFPALGVFFFLFTKIKCTSDLVLVAAAVSNALQESSHPRPSPTVGLSILRFISTHRVINTDHHYTAASIVVRDHTLCAVSVFLDK